MHACAFVPTFSLFYVFIDSYTSYRQRSTCNKYAQAVFSVLSTFVDAMSYDFANLIELFAGPQLGLWMHTDTYVLIHKIQVPHHWEIFRLAGTTDVREGMEQTVDAVIEEIQGS